MPHSPFLAFSAARRLGSRRRWPGVISLGNGGISSGASLPWSSHVSLRNGSWRAVRLTAAEETEESPRRDA